MIPLLRTVLQGAGLPAELYSSHSLRRGFATWATRSGWDQKALMSYVGWRDAKSALHYMDTTGVFPGQEQQDDCQYAPPEDPAAAVDGDPIGPPVFQFTCDRHDDEALGALRSGLQQSP